MPKAVSTRTRTPWRGGLAALVGTPALTIWGGADGRPDPLDPDGRWVMGHHHDAPRCQSGWRWDPTCGVSAITSCDEDGVITVDLDMGKPDPGPLCGPPPIMPFGIGVTEGCSLIGYDDPVPEFAALATQAYNRIFWREIGAELWGGHISQSAVAEGTASNLNQFLMNDTDRGSSCGFVEICPGEIVPLDEALLSLEHHILTHTDDGEGLIFADVKTVGRWIACGLVKRDGAVNRTVNLGFTVVTDRWFTGQGPLSLGSPAPTAASSWAYATGPLQIRIKAPEIFPDPGSAKFWEMVNAKTNDVRFVVEGLVSVTWDCVHAGIQVGPCPAIGGK